MRRTMIGILCALWVLAGWAGAGASDVPGGGEDVAPSVTDEPASAEPAKAELSSHDAALLIGLARQYEPWGAARQSERAAVIESVQSGLLSDSSASVKVSLAQWKELVRLLRGELSAESRKGWAAKIRSAYAADDAALLGLSLSQVRDLVGVLEMLGEHDTAGQLAWQWFESHHEDDGLSAGALASLASRGLQSARRSAAEKLAILEGLDKEWLAEDARVPFSASECGMIGRLWRLSGRAAKAREWAMRGYANSLGSEEAREAATSQTLTTVSYMLIDYGLTGRGKGHPAFAEVVARLGREGRLEAGWMQFYSAPLGTADDRKVVRESLLDASGNPRLAVSKVLSLAYRSGGAEEFGQWLEYLAERATAADATGDGQSLWLLCKADAEPLVPRRRNVIRAKWWLDKALASAESERGRALALAELSGFFRELDARQAAIDVIDSVRDQFTTEAVVDLLVLRQQLQGEQQTAAARGVQVRADHAARLGGN